MNILKKIIPFKIKRDIKENLGVPSLHWSLQNLKRMNFYPKTVLDIGAYEGLWTLDLLEVFPTARVFMVEAQESKRKILNAISKSHPNVDYEISLLSSGDGLEKLFFENETGSQVIEVSQSGDHCYTIISQRLDTLLDKKNIPFPDFLKLDVQGHELAVLKGADKSLRNAEICLLEVSLLDFGNNSPLLTEVVSFMDERGFQAYDISQLMRRPYDKALFQMDMFFIKKDSKIIESTRWK